MNSVITGSAAAKMGDARRRTVTRDRSEKPVADGAVLKIGRRKVDGGTKRNMSVDMLRTPAEPDIRFYLRVVESCESQPAR